MSEDDKTLEEGWQSMADALRIKQEFQRVLIDGIGVLPGEHLDQFAERIVRELQSWRTGARRRSLPAIESMLASLDARVSDAVTDRDQLKAALDALRDSHHIPYVDEDHQGGNCADIVMSMLSRATRAERDLARVEASRRDWAAEAVGLDVHADQYREVLHAIWLYVDWRYITGKLTTEQRESWASAVERVSRADHPDEPLEIERWWRPDVGEVDPAWEAVGGDPLSGTPWAEGGEPNA